LDIWRTALRRKGKGERAKGKCRSKDSARGSAAGETSTPFSSRKTPTRKNDKAPPPCSRRLHVFESPLHCRQIAVATSLHPACPQGARRYAPVFFQLDFEFHFFEFIALHG
jgi:hypothetical protein